MSILTKLLGNSKDLKLMELISGLAVKANASLVNLEQMLADYSDSDKVKTCCFNIQTLETEGDELVRQIIELLGEISITSWISHEMVIRLIHVLDDILDNAQSIVRFQDNYRLSKISPEMLQFGKILKAGGQELETMMKLFCQANWQKHTCQILEHMKKIRDLEHQGDVLKSKGLYSILHMDNNEKPLSMRDLAEFRSAEKTLELLELLTDHIYHLSNTVHQCFND